MLRQHRDPSTLHCALMCLTPPPACNTGLRRAAAEADSEEDDEDFDGAAVGTGSDSEDISSDADVDSSDAEMVPEEGERGWWFGSNLTSC